MEVVNPSMTVSRLDLVVLDFAAAGSIFRRLIVVFIDQRGGSGGTRGGQHPLGRAWTSWCALVGAAPLEQPLGCLLGPLAFFWPKKILQELHCVWTPFDIDFL